jgi:hypothetical protein
MPGGWDAGSLEKWNRQIEISGEDLKISANQKNFDMSDYTQFAHMGMLVLEVRCTLCTNIPGHVTSLPRE